MVKIIYAFRDLDIEKMARVYGLDGPERYDDYRQLFDYLREVFFTATGAFYAVLENEHGYVSTLRAEPYGDGYLIEALETRPDARNNGFATELLRAVVCGDIIPTGLPIYAHIHKKNWASLAVHRSCGFQQHLDYARFIDGSVYTHSCTMVLRR